MFNDIYRGKRVLVTGHSGFKGSWLTMWLGRLGAELCGVSLPPETEPNHFRLLNPPGRSEWCDIRDAEKLGSVLREFRPEIIFHLAAQPLVRLSYRKPVDTLAVNVGGTVNLLEAARNVPELRAVVVVTSDKCYRNSEKARRLPRKRSAPGGTIRTAPRRGAQELVAASYRDSFLRAAGVGLATCAGPAM